MIRHPSYEALSVDARCILIQMHLGFHGHNNGEIGFSIRQAMECLGSGSSRAKRALDKLQELKFIVCHAQSSLNIKTKKRANGQSLFNQCQMDHLLISGKIINSSISAINGGRYGTVL